MTETIDGSVWHMKLYRWGRNQRSRFLFGEMRRPTHLKNTNNCIWWRTVLIWVPFMILIRSSVVVVPLFAIFYPPFSTFGTSGILNTSLFIGIGIATLIGVIVGITYICRGIAFIGSRVRTMITDTSGKVLEDCLSPERKSFCSMLWASIRDAHNKVCSNFSIS